MNILPRLPSINRDGDSLPRDIQGARLVQIGTVDNDSENDELVIEYVPKDQREKHRITLLFDSRGMWIGTTTEAERQAEERRKNLAPRPAPQIGTNLP